ncbi:MAG: tetratricopeptide repeat protein [Luteitalea sp.]|nr:tetratricopeptide repeat protein [Luteitalea sp.]
MFSEKVRSETTPAAATASSITFVLCACLGLAALLSSSAAAHARTIQPAPAQPTPASTSPTSAAPGDEPRQQAAPESKEPAQSAPSKRTPVEVHPAERALLEGRLDEALSLVADRGPDDALGLVVRGRVAKARGRLDEAEQLFTRGAKRTPEGDAALELGLLLLARGRRADAEVVLDRLVVAVLEGGRDGLALARAGRARMALGEPRQANALFRAAAQVVPDHPAVHTDWGELFLETHNTAEAVGSFQTALKLDPRWSPAILGLARAHADENPSAAREAAAKALAIHPWLVDAHLLLATLAIDEDDLEGGRDALRRARVQDSTNVEAAALAAAIQFIEDRTKEGEADLARALAVNPQNGDVPRMVGERLARQYRFDEAVAFLRRAVELDPENARAHGALGLHLMRTGDEDAARAVLERAFELDPYDVVTYNLLGLLDTLAGFQTVREGELLVRMDPRDLSVLRGYLVPLAEEALSTLSARYGFTPQGPILIEVFPRHDDFAVRTLGLPGLIGGLGACFGRVVTMDSPRARPAGTFNWAATLWHELAHVITLQLSRQRIPRWLSEGVSVFEESRARPASGGPLRRGSPEREAQQGQTAWGGEAQLEFAEALSKGELQPIKELRAGFSNPKTITRTYFQASLVVARIVEKYGDKGLQAFIRAFGDGLDEETASQRAFGVGLDELQRDFDAYVQRRYAAVLPALRSPEAKLPMNGSPQGLAAFANRYAGHYFVQMAIARRLIKNDRPNEAGPLLERAARLVPFAGGEDGPQALLANLAAKAGRKDAALKHLDEHLVRDHTSIEPVRQLLQIAQEQGDEARLDRAASRLIEIAPFDPELHSTLGRLALGRGDFQTAVRELQTAIDAGPSDVAAAHTELAEAYWQAGRPAETKKHVIAALEVAPRFERAQELLLAVVDGEAPKKEVRE